MNSREQGKTRNQQNHYSSNYRQQSLNRNTNNFVRKNTSPFTDEEGHVILGLIINPEKIKVIIKENQSLEKQEGET